MARPATGDTGRGGRPDHLDLDALLYIDEDFGPIYLRGKLYWIGVDPETPGVVHVVDWKTNRTPPSDDSVRGDVQLPAYHWLVRENAERFLPQSRDPSPLISLNSAENFDLHTEFTKFTGSGTREGQRRHSIVFFKPH